MPPFASPIDAIIRATAAPRDGDRAAARARALPLLRDPGNGAGTSMHLAAALGDAATVNRLVAGDPDAARRPGGPFQWAPLVQLCFSAFIEAPDDHSRDFAAAAEALLAAGADANAGFIDPKAPADDAFRSVLYGAAGLARHAPLVRTLLAHGADPNDGEVAYHAPEGYDIDCVQLLVESGRCTPATLATMLLRKCDWHDERGVRWLLARGADARAETAWTPSILHHAIDRDDPLAIVIALLEHGADPGREVDGQTAAAFAARVGRGDVLDAFERRGIPLRLRGADALLAACARGHAPAVRNLADTLPTALDDLHAVAGEVLTRFAGVGNTSGLRALLSLGLPVDSRHAGGHPYHGLAAHSTALHAAAWRGQPAAVRLLLAAGADARTRDGRDRTPLQLAVRACVDSPWSDRRSPESVEALLRAGATPEGIALPTGYSAIDRLLSEAR